MIWPLMTGNLIIKDQSSRSIELRKQKPFELVVLNSKPVWMQKLMFPLFFWEFFKETSAAS